MMIVCIDNKFEELTKGKTYKTIKNIRVTWDSDINEDGYDAYVLVDDDGESHAYLADIFMTLLRKNEIYFLTEREIRKNKLKKITESI